MDHTDFAGLTRLEPGESLSLDNYGFQSRNPRIIDFFLKLGARTHRHDAHPALATPTAALGLVAANSGGTLPGGIDFTVGYTAVDVSGGETLLSPDETVALPAPMAAPDSVGAVAIDYTGGTLGVSTYYYVKTWVDAMGGETLASGIAEVNRDPGSATARVQITNMLADMPAGAVAWKLYKSSMGGLFGLLTSDNTATYTDDGTDCADSAARPPQVNTTNSANKVTISVPDAADFPAGTVGFRLYGALGIGGFDDPSLIRAEPIANAGSDFEVTAWNPLAGSPPVLATAVAGAAQIDPDTELLDFPWKRSVANASALPSDGNTTGDARITLNDLHVHVWDGGAWQDLTTIENTPPPWIGISASPASSPNWSNTPDSTHAAGSYYRSRDGVVRLRGVVQPSGTWSFGASTATVAELPGGYHPDIGPSEALEFLCPYYVPGTSTWYIVRVHVFGTGAIVIDGDFAAGASAGTIGYLDLSSVSFRARAPFVRWASDHLGTHDAAM